ncbi:OsmC family protein [Chitinimonas koreensis]|uniref:OsmC family protein n=1 Tax=Chitinimonas koreensis TaxID=356302 RepID=UPI00040B5A5F|nr:OsmC family protein [Chitinimonas koreensis]QNM95251.1 OsmC family protein [Chitinimonas koreensis]
MTVQARKSEGGSYLTELSVEAARWLADADDSTTAPDPHQLLDAALAACTAITLRMYAARKGFPLEDVHVSIDHVERDGVYRMQRRLEFVGDLTEVQRTRLAEIADKCPVHKTLSGRIEIATETVVAPAA